jgi:tetratricopeptide (TPR) repeat protein
MANDFRKFDEHGFPIPPGYDELRYHDDEPARRPKVAIRTKRWVMATLLLLVVVPIVFGPKILDAGRAFLGDWLASRASQKLDEGNFSGAVEDLNDAIGWNPRAQAYYAQRAACREKLNELEGSLSDWNRAIELLQESKFRRKERFQKTINLARAYRQRGWIYVRMGRKDKAMSDINRAVDTLPKFSVLNSQRGWPILTRRWNCRAPTRHFSIREVICCIS